MVTPLNMPKQRGPAGTPKVSIPLDERYWITLRKIVQNGGNLRNLRPRSYFSK